MQLLLPADLLAAVVHHATLSHPAEACGILTGPAGQTKTVARQIPMHNAAHDPHTGFVFDVNEQLAAYADMDKRGEDPVVVYHSHPRGRATLSGRDQAHAAHTTAVWLVVATSTRPPQVQAWRMQDGTPVKVEVVVGDPRPATRPDGH